MTGAVIGGLGSAGFYGAGRAVEVLWGSVGRSKGGRETKEIYRAVSPEEYDDIFTTKGFRARPDGRSFQAKEFGNNFEETLEFANKSIDIDKAAIIKVTIPENVYNQLEHMNLDHAIFKSGTPVVESEMLERFNESIICIKHIFKEKVKMRLEPDVEAIFEFVGHRNGSLYEGYRPEHLVCENCLTTGIHSYYNLEEDTYGKIKGTITFISPEEYPECLWRGKKLRCMKGKK